MHIRHLLIPAALLACVPQSQSPAHEGQAPRTLPSGAHWNAEVPANWNGTLLLWSRGYSPRLGEPEVAARGLREALLAEGYALAGSDYGAAGWALERAVPAQRDTVAAFAAVYGKPKRVIAWGHSMGGLVTTALAEQRPAAVDGALAMCASIGGAVGMMNMALDGAYAFRTLVAPDAGIRLVDVDDDRANARRVADALAAAMQTPAGRARIALAGVLAGIPGWTSADRAEPAAGDVDAQLEEIARSFAMGVFLPRADQESRAGGAFSWNTNIDYRRQLARSGRRALVEALYRKAGVDLEADLVRLNAGPRVKAEPKAVAYMLRHYTPNARPQVPLLAVQAIGDGLTSPSLQRGYAEAARGDVRSLYVRAAGHCGFTPEVTLAAIRHLDQRLRTGRWGAMPAAFVAYTPPPMLRPCVRGRACK
ncbi:alpha/beta hydrolase [Sphingomonas psychrotolerans]|uniref:Alpha/beta hydrolase n=1 Tax=Sphingomonas psychrotolerans TaxID=1327635 RepID=A0ABU3N1J2_9SPHN|nr:alpha/beta hydrolase [Sphingomonas psychrotolerans]MDT8758428.1 alpha/beta hydrolase [Sphingomonas psychrotolerans]